MGNPRTEAKKRNKRNRKIRIWARETTKTRAYRDSGFADLTMLDPVEIEFYLKLKRAGLRY